MPRRMLSTSPLSLPVVFFYLHHDSLCNTMRDDIVAYQQLARKTW